MLQESTADQPAGTASTDEMVLGRWLLLIYRLPAEPSSARTAIWRETKRLGALSLQHAACLLPLTDANQSAYDRLTHRIEEYGGEATVLETASPHMAWQAKTVQ